MTAEIAVMNKGGIALAADSKVTVSTGGVSKTYDTVSKLFTLSKVAPVGVMIYGNAEFMGYPWETIIKLYRQKKGRKTELTIVEWSEDFFTFLDQFGNITDDDKYENAKNICLSTLFEAITTFEERAKAQGIALGTPEFEEGLRLLLERRAESALACDPWVPKRQQSSLAKTFAGPIGDAISMGLDGFTDETKRAAIALMLATLLLQASSPQVSGIVIAGFGDDEYFPTLIETRIDGYVGKKIKRYIIGSINDISRDNNACVRAFAQREMVQRFMEGIDPSYSQYLSNAIPELVVDNCFETLEKYGIKKNKTDEIKDKIKEAVGKAVLGFENEAEEYRRAKFSAPVVRMVSVLPKDELAHLAESLVALTSLKRRVSSDAETVGGPIDVALISKGDGFVWIKRKHYFREDLNRQFARTYMDGINDGEPTHDETERSTRTRGKPTERSPRKAQGNGKSGPDASASEH